MPSPLAAENDAWTGDPQTDRAMLVARSMAALDHTPRRSFYPEYGDVRPTIGGGGAIVVVPASIARSNNIGGGGLICVVYPDETPAADVTAYIAQAHAIAKMQEDAMTARRRPT
jgi:hypothetical protein